MAPSKVSPNVSRCRHQPLRIVLEQTDTSVAVMADESTNFVCAMIVVYRKPTPSAVDDNALWPAADRAETFLPLVNHLIVCCCYAVFLL